MITDYPPSKIKCAQTFSIAMDKYLLCQKCANI